MPTNSQDAITADNVLVKVETSVFYRITEPEKTVYRIRDVDGAISTTVAGIVRSEIGKLELDQVQSNRAEVTANIRGQVRAMVDDWGIEVTRAEILDVNLDEATRTAMLQQLNAERARRAQVTEAEGKKRAVELNADAELYAAEQEAKARRVLADAEAYATGVIAGAIKENGMALEFAEKTWRSHRSLVYDAVWQNGLALKFASEELRSDLEIVQRAVRQNGLALEFAAEELRSDLEVARMAVNHNDLALAFASEELQRRFIAEIIQNLPGPT